MKKLGEKKRIVPYIEKTSSKVNVVLRQEHKYLINCFQFSKGISAFSKVLTADVNNNENGYRVRSLYFDTLDDSDYHDKVDGLDNRKKIRLRIYDPDDEYAKLEVKLKQNDYQVKKSIRIAREHAIELCSGEYLSLLKYDDPFAVECYSTMMANLYRPKVIVEYSRIAYVGQGTNNVRLTFDHSINSTESCYDIFSKNLALTPINHDFESVLEVKYNGFLYSYMKDMLDSIDKSKKSFSKYCIARKITMGEHL